MDLEPPLKVVWNRHHKVPSSGWNPANEKPLDQERWGWGLSAQKVLLLELGHGSCTEVALDSV